MRVVTVFCLKVLHAMKTVQMQYEYRRRYGYVYWLLYTLSGGLKSNQGIWDTDAVKCLVLITPCSPIGVNGIFYTWEEHAEASDVPGTQERNHILVFSNVP